MSRATISQFRVGNDALVSTTCQTVNTNYDLLPEKELAQLRTIFLLMMIMTLMMMMMMMMEVMEMMIIDINRLLNDGSFTYPLLFIIVILSNNFFGDESELG